MYVQIQTFFCCFCLYTVKEQVGNNPTDGKVGAGFKCEGQRTAGSVVEVTQAQEEWGRTGAQNEQVAHKQEGELMQ